MQDCGQQPIHSGDVLCYIGPIYTGNVVVLNRWNMSKRRIVISDNQPLIMLLTEKDKKLGTIEVLHLGEIGYLNVDDLTNFMKLKCISSMPPLQSS